MEERKRSLKGFLMDETGFVTKDKIIVSGMVCGSLWMLLESSASGYTGHFNKNNYHANCLTNDGGCGVVKHINETRHLNHTSSCY